MIFDQFVDLGGAVAGHTKNILGEAFYFGRNIASTLPKRLAHFFDGLLAEIGLK